VRSLEADLAACLAFYRFPPHLWSRIRTVNLVERIFREARRHALPAVPATDGEEGTDDAAGPPAADGSPAWNGHPASTFVDLEPPLPAETPGEAARPATAGQTEGAAIAQRPEVAVAIAHRPEDAVAALAEPEAPDLSADEAFAQWLQADERRRRAMKVAAAATSVAGMISGALLSLLR